MTDFPPFSQLLSRATVQALQMRCLTFSRVNWLRNGESSKAGEYIWRTLYKGVKLRNLLDLALVLWKQHTSLITRAIMEVPFLNFKDVLFK